MQDQTECAVTFGEICNLLKSARNGSCNSLFFFIVTYRPGYIHVEKKDGT